MDVIKLNDRSALHIKMLLYFLLESIQWNIPLEEFESLKP